MCYMRNEEKFAVDEKYVDELLHKLPFIDADMILLKW